MKPNLPVLGPKLGRALAGRPSRRSRQVTSKSFAGGGFRAAGHDLGPDEVLVERQGKEGWAVAAADGVTVALELSRSTTSWSAKAASTSSSTR